tara:strand:- start:49 stop:252 length:204 start_codon:yes stop_codon:yes gene_type:complete
MWKKLNEYVHHKIVANYNKMDTRSTIEDAAFYTFLVFVERIMFYSFLIVASISFFLFGKYELIPLFN